MKHLLLISGLFVLVGCAKSSPQPQQQTPRWKVELGKYEDVELTRPQITRDKNELVIEGTVKRKPGSLGEIGEKVAIVFASSEGKYLDQILLKVEPKDVQPAGSKYSVRYGWIPPEGTTIYVNMAGDKTIPMQGSAAGAPSVTSPVVSQSNFTYTPLSRPPQPVMPSRPSTPNPGTRGNR